MSNHYGMDFSQSKGDDLISKVRAMPVGQKALLMRVTDTQDGRLDVGGYRERVATLLGQDSKDYAFESKSQPIELMPDDYFLTIERTGAKVH